MELKWTIVEVGLPQWLSGKKRKSTRNAGTGGDTGSIPGSQDDPLVVGRATHSSTTAWRIPRTEVSDGLQSTELQGIGHE